MPDSRDEILDAALRLPEADRLLIATRLLQTVPDERADPVDDDEVFLAELERRASDAGPTIPLGELWSRELP